VIVALGELGSRIARQAHHDQGKGHAVSGGVRRQWDRNSDGASAFKNVRVAPPKMNSCSLG
jgi:hypothetical protein